MNKIIVYKFKDGSCSIGNPAPGMFDPLSPDRCNLRKRKIDFEDVKTNTETNQLSLTGRDVSQEILEFIAKKAIKKLPKDREFLSFRITALDNLPNNRDFREAWTDDFVTETIDVHNEKAKEIQLQRLRIERNKALQQNDIEYLIAQKNNDEKKLFALTKKQKELLAATDNLKTLEIKEFNCLRTLEEIKELGEFK